MLNCENHLLWFNREIGYVVHGARGLLKLLHASKHTIWGNIHQWDDQLKNNRKHCVHYDFF